MSNISKFGINCKLFAISSAPGSPISHSPNIFIQKTYLYAKFSN